MSANEFLALSPLLLLAGASVLIMLLVALRCSHRIIQLGSSCLFIISFVLLFYAYGSAPRLIEPLLIVDGFSLFITGLIICSAFVVNILSYIYFEEKEEGPKEYYVLLFLCTLGACVLALSKHFISLFLGLEILTVGLYALISYLRERNFAIEAGIKYLVLAAFSSAFLLFGMALVYLETGSMDFSALSKYLSLYPPSAVFFMGLGMMLVGIGFKLAVVPFHMWTADVYQGAPAPVTAFIATASKGGIFAVLFRFFLMTGGFQYNKLTLVLTFIALASMLVGNLLALQQNNVKRILAYSSIAHLGYMLVAFIPGSPMSISAIGFYLLAYFVTTLAAFGVVTVISDKGNDAENLESYRGLFWRQPLLACIFSSALISLAGIPLTAGFIGKFYILAASIQARFWLPALMLVLGSVIGLFYYLRIITRMFSSPLDVGERPSAHPVFYLLSSATLSVLSLLIIWFGIYPSGLISLMDHLWRR